MADRPIENRELEIIRDNAAYVVEQAIARSIATERYRIVRELEREFGEAWAIEHNEKLGKAVWGW